MKSPVLTVAVVSLLIAGCGTQRARFTKLGLNAQGCEEILWQVDSAVMVMVRAGTFVMGPEPDSIEPDVGREVFVDEFCIDKYEVTNRQYREFCDATGREYPPIEELGSLEDYFTAYPGHPVVAVSWEDAAAYCAWAGKRLPTEAEWEKAARGRSGLVFPWGNEAPDAGRQQRANWGAGNDREQWKEDGYEFTAPVGSFAMGVSPYGCLDMAGNVHEWCANWYAPGPPERDSNPRGPESGMFRVCRGGSWNSDAMGLQSAGRLWFAPTLRKNHRLGFRCAWSQ